MTYVSEHKAGIWWLIKHAGPYVAGFWAIIVGLIATNWLDLPARSQALSAVERTVTLNAEKLSLIEQGIPPRSQTLNAVEDTVNSNAAKLAAIETEQRSLIVDRAVQINQLENIEEKVDGFDNKLDKLLEYLIRRDGRL